MDAYVRLRRGGYQPALGFLSTAYDDQDVFSGFYRDDNWTQQLLPAYAWFTYNAGLGNVDVLSVAPISPATGGPAVPDPQAEAGGDATAAPRSLTWKETRLTFWSGAAGTGTVVGQFWVKDIMGWSGEAPNVE